MACCVLAAALIAAIAKFMRKMAGRREPEWSDDPIQIARRLM